jgi:hypothetical protein
MTRTPNLRELCFLGAARLDRALGLPWMKRRFRRKLGYAPDIAAPRTFNEKIQWRKLHDRNPDFPVIANKHLCRAYVADRLGQAAAEKLLVPVLQHCRTAEEIDFDALPEAYALKATHGSGMNLIVTRRDEVDRDEIRRTCRRWLRTPFKPWSQQWFYNVTPRSLIVEPLLCAPDGTLDEISAYVFNGKARFLRYFRTVDFADGKRGRAAVSLWPDGRPAGFENPNRPALENPQIPPYLPELVAAAEQVARDLDFVRVDFYCLPDRFWLGELTLTPANGTLTLTPASTDLMLGDFWTLPAASAPPARRARAA